MQRDFQMPGRSAVYAANGMAATSHPLASSAAIDILRAGGNAVDAAVAASAVLCVAEPHMTSLGGDCFVIIAEADGTVHGLNGSGRAPAALTPDFIRSAGLDEVHPDHGVSVTVPGAVDAWARLLDRFGTIGLDRALAPAIDLAETGVPIAPRVARDWAAEAHRLTANEGARLHYLKPDGSTPGAGDRIVFPKLAATMRLIAEGGPSGFYEGPIAEDIVAAVSAHGGCLTLSDLAAVKADWVDPISSPYRDRSVGELPPNGQGIVALIMLSILNRFDLGRLSPLDPERLHIEVEAARLAYACREAFVSDPDTALFPAAHLLDDAHIDALAARIDPNARMDHVGTVDPRDHTDTVYFCVVDGNGLAVSFINSLFSGFGSAIAGLDSGVLLQNRGACFVTVPDHPNEVGPGKRPMHTLIPGLLARGGDVEAVFGVMGGHYQACGHGHVLGNLVDYGCDPQMAIDLPRVFFSGETTEVETTLPQASIDGLAARGHRIALRAEPLGGGQMIVIDRQRGVLTGGSDPRKDGCAIGF